MLKNLLASKYSRNEGDYTIDIYNGFQMHIHRTERNTSIALIDALGECLIHLMCVSLLD